MILLHNTSFTSALVLCQPPHYPKPWDLGRNVVILRGNFNRSGNMVGILIPCLTVLVVSYPVRCFAAKNIYAVLVCSSFRTLICTEEYSSQFEGVCQELVLLLGVIFISGGLNYSVKKSYSFVIDIILCLRLFLWPLRFRTLRRMAKVQLCNVVVLDNPAPFFNPFQFELTFECIEELKEGMFFWHYITRGSLNLKPFYPYQYFI